MCKDEDNPFVATDEELKELIYDGNGGETILPSVEVKSSPIVKENAVDVEPDDSSEILIPETKEIQKVKLDEHSEDIEADYKYIRTNLYTITERSIEALENLSNIADQSQHPRAYEVLAQLVKTISDAQKDLISLHKEKINIDGEKQEQTGNTTPGVVNNNLFVGTAAGLDELIAKMIKNKKNDA